MEKSVLAGNGIVKMETGEHSMATGNQRLQGVAERKTAHGAKSRKQGAGISIQRLLLMMAAVMMALAAFTACFDEDENGGDEDGDGNGNGGGGGGVAGKRIKTTLLTEGSGAIQRCEYTYNSDGSQKRVDAYDASSKSIGYSLFTNNSDGTLHKWEDFSTHGDEVLVYTYDANKKPLKAEGTVHNSLGIFPVSHDFTFQNGRLIRVVLKTGNPGDGYVEITYESKYDSNGRRTTTTETHSLVGTRQYTRTYNSDGTLQKVTAGAYPAYPTTGFTQTFTWENGKTTVNSDDYAFF